MNNYNCNNKGINIELFVHYDNEQSLWNFNDNFKNIKDDVYWYSTWDGIPVPDCFNDLYDITEPDRETSYEILIDELHYDSDSISDCEFNKSTAWDEVFNDYSFPLDLDDFNNMLESYGVTYDKLYETVYSRGYSQGDYVEVLVPTQIRKNYGLKDDVDLAEHVQEDVDHFLWDSPLFCRITINDEEYYSETFDGMYTEFDKNIFIDEILEDYKDDGLDMELLKEELVSLVPDEPKWN